MKDSGASPDGCVPWGLFSNASCACTAQTEREREGWARFTRCRVVARCNNKSCAPIIWYSCLNDAGSISPAALETRRLFACISMRWESESKEVFAREQSYPGNLLTSCTRSRFSKGATASRSLALRVCSSALTLSIRLTFNINFIVSDNNGTTKYSQGLKGQRFVSGDVEGILWFVEALCYAGRDKQSLFFGNIDCSHIVHFCFSFNGR